jgi:hypothetical protein
MHYTKEQYKEFDEVKVVIISVHGILSDNKNMHDTMEAIKDRFQLRGNAIHYKEINYGYTRALVNMLTWSRNVVRDNVSARIANASNKYRNAKIIVLGHSNGTWAIGRGIEKWYPTTSMRIDLLILVGCVLKRKFRWNRFSKIQVLNIVGTKDWVSLISKWTYRMGQAGVKGFKHRTRNLRQVEYKMGHTGFVDVARPEILKTIETFIEKV